MQEGDPAGAGAQEHGGDTPSDTPMARPAGGGLPPGLGGASFQEVMGSLAAAANALAGAAGSAGSGQRSYDSAAKLVKSPEVFAPKSLEEEVSQWPDWSFSFRVFVGFVDPKYAEELVRVESGPLNPALYSQEEKERSIKLYAILASYLRNRPLKLLKSEGSQDGYSVWKKLFQELEPSSRTRGLAMAQALVSFPAMTKGTSILDYLLTYEKLVGEYEKVSGARYDENLKIGTVLKGLPNELRNHILVGLSPTTSYTDIRRKLLEYERSTQSWNAENILQSFSMEGPTKHTPYNGPQAMEVDRVKGGYKGDKGKYGKERNKGKGKGEKGGKSFGKGRFTNKGKGKGKWDTGKESKGKGKDRNKGVRAVEGGYGSTKFQGSCYICGKPGHRATDCWQKGDKGKGGKGKVRYVEEEETQGQGDRSSGSNARANNDESGQVRVIAASAARMVRRVEEVEDQDEELDLNEVSWRMNEWEVRRLEEFDLTLGDEESDEGEIDPHDELMEWYDSKQTGEEVGEVRTLQDEKTVKNVCKEVESCEVVLDSGADCHVLPMDWAEEVGEPSTFEYRLKDAQGRVIPTLPVRQQVKFVFWKESGKKLVITDTAVCGNVTQPLFSIGKMWKLGWGTVSEDGKLWLKKGTVRVPLHFKRNSSMAIMSISRVVTEEMKVQPVRLEENLKRELQHNEIGDSWFVLEDGTPARFDWDVTRTFDPTGHFPNHMYEGEGSEGDYFPYRTTLLGKLERKGGAVSPLNEVDWNSLEFFECSEEWKDRENVSLGRTPNERFEVMITLLEKEIKEPNAYGSFEGLKEREKEFGGENQPMETGEPTEAVVPRQEEKKEHRSKGIPVLPEDETEVMLIGPLRITPTSELKEMKEACKYLYLSKNGSKGVLWQRLKKEVATNKLKATVQISEDIRKEFERDPIPEALPALPSQEEIEKHELTHLPRASWCEACQAAKSREDNFDESTEKPQRPVFSLDFMFTGTQGEEGEKDPLAIQLVGVDSETKFLLAVAVPTKGGDAVINHAVAEVTRVLALLGYSDVVLRTDTEPAMLAIRKGVQAVRARHDLKTELQDSAPGEHQGLTVERYIQTVRKLAKTLLATVEQRSGTKIGSDVPLYSWAFRHAAWLQNRYHVGRDGRTAFEATVDRTYKGKLAPFGSAIIAKALPKAQEKGEPWEKGVFLGKDYASNLNLVGTSRGVIKARTMRRRADAYQPELLQIAVGAPWDHQLKTLRQRKRRVLPLEEPELPPLEAPKEGKEKESEARPQSSSGGKQSSKSSSSNSPPGSDPMSEGGIGSAGEESDEDPGEVKGKRKAEEELFPDETSLETLRQEAMKRDTREALEDAEESPKKGPKLDEGTGEVEERSGKAPKVGEASGSSSRVSAEVVHYHIRRFEKSEEPEEHGDELLDLEETKMFLEETKEWQEKWSEKTEESSEDLRMTWSHEYDDGPPKLDREDLEKVDAKSERTEIERLLEMKVLTEAVLDEKGEPVPTPEGKAPKQLSTKYVLDWRHRQGQWKRRARLVAREYRWLTDYDLTALYSPTSISSSIKLLSALCASSPGYEMISIDISDAYLQVPQKEYTVVSLGGKWYKLEFTLPGQRTGSSDWFEHLRKILEEEKMTSDIGLPSFFYKLPSGSEGGTLMSTHVDDLEVFGKPEENNAVVSLLLKHKLKIKLEGPVKVGEGKCTFLKRTFLGIPGGIEIRMDGKYLERLEELLGLGKAHPKKLPFPTDYGRSMKDETPLNAEEHHLYRSCVGILLYMTPERPDLGFATKWLSGKLATPTRGDLAVLRHVAKYVKATSHYVIEHMESHPGKSFLERNEIEEEMRFDEKSGDVFTAKSLIEVVTDADWATDRETRQSTSCALIFVNGNLVHFHARKQKATALSSCESELVAAVGGLSEGVFLQNLLERVLKIKPEMRIHMDSSSARAILMKKGFGRTRHVDAGLLWVQQLTGRGLKVKAIKGTENPSDVGTKALTRSLVVKCLEKMGVRTGEESREPKGASEFKIPKKYLRRIVMMLMVQGSEGLKSEKKELSFGFYMFTGIMVMMLLFMVCSPVLGEYAREKLCVSAAVFSSSKREGQVEKKKREKEKMEAQQSPLEATEEAAVKAHEAALKEMIMNAKSLEAVELLNKALKLCRSGPRENLVLLGEKVKELDEKYGVKEKPGSSAGSEEKEVEKRKVELLELQEAAKKRRKGIFDKKEEKQPEEKESLEEESDEESQEKSEEKQPKEKEKKEEESDEESQEKKDGGEKEETSSEEEDVQEILKETAKKEVLEEEKNVKELLGKMTEKKEKLDEARRAFASTSERYEEAKVYRAVKVREKENLSELWDKLEDELEKSKKDCEAIEAQADEILEHEEELEKEMDELRPKLAEALRELGEKRKELRKYEKEERPPLLNPKVDVAIKEELMDLRLGKQKVEIELQEVQEQNEKLKKKKEENEKEMEAMKGELEMLRKRKRESVGSMDEEKAKSMKEENKTLKKSIKGLSETNKKLESDFQKLKSEKGQENLEGKFVLNIEEETDEEEDKKKKLCILCSRHGHSYMMCWDAGYSYDKNGKYTPWLNVKNEDGTERTKAQFRKYFRENEKEIRAEYAKLLDENKKKFRKGDGKGKGKKPKEEGEKKK